MYFMFNCFWTKAVIWYKSTEITHFYDPVKQYNFYLTNLDEETMYLATLTGGFRCALANVIAFSSIMGRAGPLEAVFVVIFGTIGYELNRQIIRGYNVDVGGSNAIFVFAGFMGLILGFFKYLKERTPETSTAQHFNYSANRSSAAFALIGTLLTWVFFPVLAMDFSDFSVSETPIYTGPYGVIFALCAATIASFIFSALLNDGIVVRDIIYGPIAGGVASSTASYWVVNPVYCVVIGAVAGTLQVIIMNLLEKKIAKSGSIFNTFSFTLFGIQGLIGAIFAAIWSAGIRTNQYGFNYKID
jgi:ammonium transporter Rh